MCYQSFSLFGLGGLTPGAKYTNGERTWRTTSSTILQNFIALRQPTPEISVTKILQTNKQTKQVRQLSWLAYIPTCRSPITAKHKQFTTPAVTEQRRPVSHTRPTVGQVCRTGRSSVERVNNFSIFDRGGLTPGPKVTKRGDDLLSIEIYHPTKFQPDRANDLRDMRYLIFFQFLA